MKTIRAFWKGHERCFIIADLYFCSNIHWGSFHEEYFKIHGLLKDHNLCMHCCCLCLFNEVHLGKLCAINFSYNFDSSIHAFISIYILTNFNNINKRQGAPHILITIYEERITFWQVVQCLSGVEESRYSESSLSTNTSPVWEEILSIER